MPAADGRGDLSGFGVVRLGPGDAAVMRALKAVFAAALDDPESYAAEPPGDAHLTGLLAKEHVAALVARSGGEVVGGLVAYGLDEFERTRREFCIYDPAVAAGHRRRGVVGAELPPLPHSRERTGGACAARVRVRS